MLSHPKNAGHPLPLILSGPGHSESYFTALDDFIRTTLGPEFTKLYDIVIDAPSDVAARMRQRVGEVFDYRDSVDDAANFNWSLTVDHRFQAPFPATHDAMATLELQHGLPPHELACNLRRAFSGIVAGNVKESGIRAVARHGPFDLHAEPAIAAALETLLQSFIREQRMRLPGTKYEPCYRVSDQPITPANR